MTCFWSNRSIENISFFFTCNLFSFSALISSLIWWRFWLGTIEPDSSARMVLTKPTNGAATSVLPTLLLIEPTIKVLLFSAQRTSAMALASTLSNLWNNRSVSRRIFDNHSVSKQSVISKIILALDHFRYLLWWSNFSFLWGKLRWLLKEYCRMTSRTFQLSKLICTSIKMA